jgi:hypothetical protein
VVMICISFMARDGEHFFMFFFFGQFGRFPLKKFCLAQLLTSLLIHQFLGNLVFEPPVYSIISSLSDV